MASQPISLPAKAHLLPAKKLRIGLGYCQTFMTGEMLTKIRNRERAEDFYVFDVINQISIIFNSIGQIMGLV